MLIKLGVCAVGSPCKKNYKNILFLQYFLCKNLILLKSTMNWVRATHLPNINQNKLDNRMLNLRLATQSEQNVNKKYNKFEESIYNLERPPNMEDIRLPRYVEYRKEYRDIKNKTGMRDYFVITHDKCPKYGKKNAFVSTKSMKVSAIEKYTKVLDIMKELNFVNYNRYL